MAAFSGAFPSLLEMLGIRVLSSKSEAFSNLSKRSQVSKIQNDQCLQSSYFLLDVTSIMPLINPAYCQKQPASLQTSFVVCETIINPIPSINHKSILQSQQPSSRTFVRQMSMRSSQRLGSIGNSSRQSRGGKSQTASAQSVHDFIKRALAAESGETQKAFLYGVAAKTGTHNSTNDSKLVRLFKVGGSWLSLIPLSIFTLVVSFMAYQKLKKSADTGAVEGGTTIGGAPGGDGSFKPVSFRDVIGCDEVKEELLELVHYLKNPDVPSKLGGRVPHGFLLVGPPGVGKTMLARAVATEAGVPFFYASGSGFDEVFVGVGANRVRELFALARKNAPSVIFIDEIDAIGGSRQNGNSGNRQTINQLLSEMDGFSDNNGVVVIAATNLGSILDGALTRAGRFDTKMHIHMPDANGRLKLMKHYISKVRTNGNMDVEKLATTLFGYTGAAIENLVNQAALRAANTDSEFVILDHLNWARDKIDMGRERKRFNDKDEQNNTAYHEAAHTVVAHGLGMPIYSVTIESRGQTGGHMKPFVTEDFNTRDDLLNYLAVCMAGKIGEEIIEGKGKHTTGCSQDYVQAQSTASNYIQQCGFGQKLYVPVTKRWRTSNSLQEKIDSETKILLDEADAKAKQILSSNYNGHKKLADALLKKPTLSADEVKTILG